MSSAKTERTLESHCNNAFGIEITIVVEIRAFPYFLKWYPNNFLLPRVNQVETKQNDKQVNRVENIEIIIINSMIFSMTP